MVMGFRQRNAYFPLQEDEESAPEARLLGDVEGGFDSDEEVPRRKT